MKSWIVSILVLVLFGLYSSSAEIGIGANSQAKNRSGKAQNDDSSGSNKNVEVPPLEFIEETVILGEDIIDPGSSIELTVTNSESPFINTESPETPIAAVVVEVEKEEKQKHVTADDIKLYLLVQRLLNETPLIDGHNDLPYNIRKFIHGQLSDFNFNSDLKNTPPWSRSVWSHTDLPRLRRGRVGAQWFVAYAPCQSQNQNAVQITLEQIDLIIRLVSKYPDHMKLAFSADDIVQAHKEGKIASLIGVEGGHSIGNSLATLRAFYDLGADSSLVDNAGHKPQHGGLTEFGRTVVKEMNRLGMLVDLSHTSRLTMMDVFQVSKAPVIFSHSSAFALCNSTRNVPDDILQELVFNGGIVMVAFFNFFVKCSQNATVVDVADHINYIRGRIGIDTIGIGSGYDGINFTPTGLEDVEKYPHLFVELARNPGWSNDDLKKVAGENFLRVFRDAEQVRDSMRSIGVQPSQQEIVSSEYLEESARCRYNLSTSSGGNASIH
ncbi:Dipeptidase 1 [Folsomia candida]|uniref:Dipeptidase n=1 Tax=Folsomia candida TaxID=158441 RepID=A0A226F187_FOLCA|nr:Dipeptidase 1 [Folsomia candida]